MSPRGASYKTDKVVRGSPGCRLGLTWVPGENGIRKCLSDFVHESTARFVGSRGAAGARNDPLLARVVARPPGPADPDPGYEADHDSPGAPAGSRGGDRPVDARRAEGPGADRTGIGTAGSRGGVIRRHHPAAGRPGRLAAR